MPVLAQHIGRHTPMGATPVAGGVTFRVWAPTARHVHVISEGAPTTWVDPFVPDPATRLIPLGDETWAGFVPGLADGSPYLFWIAGTGSTGFKRDPFARELGLDPPFPNAPCLVRDPRTYRWHDDGWQPPARQNLAIYQLHVGAFWSVDANGHDRRRNVGRFLDVIGRLAYLRDLGVTALLLLPVQEFPGTFSLGYNGVDYFSPEMAYQVDDAAELAWHLGQVNAILAAYGQPPLGPADLASGCNQLKCLVDLCHLHGLAVLFDLVFNHAGGDFGDRSLHFFDRQPADDNNRSLYFTDQGWAGGLIFAYWNEHVRQFLIDNARFFLDEYRIDGIRYDEVTVISHHGGDRFCRDLTGTLRYHRPGAVQIAEYWDWDRARAVTPPPDGLGFDAALSDRLRDAVRHAVQQAATGRDATVDLDAVAAALHPPPGFPDAASAVHCLENHDIVRWDHEHGRPRAPRLAALADPGDPRSWYARGRARVGTALLLTAPGLPLLFMGQEFLEAQPWHDDLANWSRFLIDWSGLAHDQAMADHHRFTRDLLHLRQRRPALTGGAVRVPLVHNHDRVLTLHRWIEGTGEDVVVVVSLSEAAHRAYPVGLPFPGTWHEILNGDVYDRFPNPSPVGNGGRVTADQPGRHGFAHAALVTIPAHGVLVLARTP